MRHIAFLVAYDGGAFCGSQRQTTGAAFKGELERALETVFKVPTPVALAGRTDAGSSRNGAVGSFQQKTNRFP
jgi:tRNA pseudouridine38-40 synthase